MSDTNNYCARCGRLNTCKRTCYYETDFNGNHIQEYNYDSSSSDEGLSYMEELIEYLMSIKIQNVIT